MRSRACIPSSARSPPRGQRTPTWTTMRPVKDRAQRLVRLAELVQYIQAVDEVAVDIQVVAPRGAAALARWQLLLIFGRFQGNGRAVQHLLGHIDRHLRPDGQRDRVAWPRI